MAIFKLLAVNNEQQRAELLSLSNSPKVNETNITSVSNLEYLFWWRIPIGPRVLAKDKTYLEVLWMDLPFWGN